MDGDEPMVRKRGERGLGKQPKCRGDSEKCHRCVKKSGRLPQEAREPVGFVLQPARRGRKRARTASASVDNRLAYTMPGSVQATIVQNLNVV